MNGRTMATTEIEAQGPELGSGPLARLACRRRVVERLEPVLAGGRHLLPKRLYARSLLIIITPMIILQSVVTLVFMERHWQQVTQRLSTATTARPRRDRRHDRDAIRTTTAIPTSSASPRSGCR